MHPTAARYLKEDDVIRLTDGRFSRITSINFEEHQLIVGGPESRTAAPLRIQTDDGASFLVHPGQIIGLSGEVRTSSKRTPKLLSRSPRQ